MLRHRLALEFFAHSFIGPHGLTHEVDVLFLLLFTAASLVKDLLRKGGHRRRWATALVEEVYVLHKSIDLRRWFLLRLLRISLVIKLPCRSSSRASFAANVQCHFLTLCNSRLSRRSDWIAHDRIKIILRACLQGGRSTAVSGIDAFWIDRSFEFAMLVFDFNRYVWKVSGELRTCQVKRLVARRSHRVNGEGSRRVLYACFFNVVFADRIHLCGLSRTSYAWILRVQSRSFCLEQDLSHGLAAILIKFN